MPHCLQLHGHLKGDMPTKRMTAQQVRTLRLYGLYGLHVVPRHFLDAGVGFCVSVQPPRLQAVKWLVTAKKVRQFEEVKNRAAYTRHAEERPFCALLQGYEMGKVLDLLVATENLGQSLDGWRLQQGGRGSSVPNLSLISARSLMARME